MPRRELTRIVVKAQTAQTGFPLTEDEVNSQASARASRLRCDSADYWSQMKTLMLAGYETTSGQPTAFTTIGCADDADVDSQLA
jgi:hypothetical protein